MAKAKPRGKQAVSLNRTMLLAGQIFKPRAQIYLEPDHFDEMLASKSVEPIDDPAPRLIPEYRRSENAFYFNDKRYSYTPEEAEEFARRDGHASVAAQIAEEDRLHAVYIADQEERRRRGGRPKSEHELNRVSIYKHIAAKATFVASVRDIPLHQYLSEIAQATVEADFVEAQRQLAQ